MKLTDTSQLDWVAVNDAAQTIISLSQTGLYAAPEALDIHHDAIRQVVAQLNIISKALLITPPGSR